MPSDSCAHSCCASRELVPNFILVQVGVFHVSDLLGSRNLKFVRDDIVSLRRIAAIEHLRENCQWSMQLKEIVLKNLCQDDKSVVNC